ncbi:hypothetical protein H8356DRAFT_1276793 [Neocallimastix lanati (nom. inval.)]|uniref:SH3 domain-containing protein n=1 Tax=Neocallimastix californiae TaxID=1754190 RepID=A0A1Y2AHE2_9FUNG|nr:hypothetical protein H8356DRAFT_1276793 [Neocallimastix sp. JGI-2020a]ORY21936.1 hypothetical protein LY90DRAFT_515826 [Neocallimastix californiae]|eukprot:ORY21936.1 hypothetical protein LY90DRAFT_515826 [Neocallimastix californiae]
MTDCVYFQTIIKELNPADTNFGDCCGWSMVECDDKNNIVKLDFSGYQGIQNKIAFPPTVQYLTNIKEFSISGQKNINEIYSFPSNNLEKVDLSNSGLSSSIFPTWIIDAPNIKELDISNTEITGFPQRNIKSDLQSCNFSNTPICSSYQSSPFANYIPDNCKSTCSGGYNGSSSNSNSGKKPNSGGSKSSSKVWPFILIGIVVLAILGALGFLYMKKSKKKDKLDTIDSPKPISPSSKNYRNKEKSIANDNNDGDDDNGNSIEITINENTSSLPNTSEIVRPLATTSTTTAAAVTIPPAAIVKHNNNSKKIDEVDRNNYISAYGGSNGNQNAFKNNYINGVPVKNIYSEHNSKEKKEMMQDQPALLRRKSSKKSSTKDTPSSSIEESEQLNEELFIANWDYVPTLSDELALVAGDIIEIKKKFDDGWSTGYNRRTKQTGIVPLCYLKEYDNED